MPLKDRTKMLTVWLSDAEMEQVKTLAADIDAPVAYLVRSWIRTSWQDRVKDENARTFDAVDVPEQEGA